MIPMSQSLTAASGTACGRRVPMAVVPVAAGRISGIATGRSAMEPVDTCWTALDGTIGVMPVADEAKRLIDGGARTPSMCILLRLNECRNNGRLFCRTKKQYHFSSKQNNNELIFHCQHEKNIGNANNLMTSYYRVTIPQ